MGLSASSPAAAGQPPAEPAKLHQAASPPAECPMHQERKSGNCAWSFNECLTPNSDKCFSRYFFYGKNLSCSPPLQVVCK